MRNITHRPFIGLLAGLAFCALTTASAAAQPAAPRSDDDRPPPPPPEALQACASLGAGAACQFTTPRGTMKGTCGAPEGKPLACRPKDRPHDKPSGQDPRSER